jgi:integral membrane protein (TIGR01906 family)
LTESSLSTRILRFCLQVIIPIILLLGSVWIILLTAKFWVPLEYRMPGFPPDRYGFTLQDRIQWSGVDIRFLLGSEPISYFDRYQLDDGSPMHNERELVHMEDVKNLIDLTRWILLGGAALALGITYLLIRMEGKPAAGRAWRNGARWTAVLMVLLGMGLVLGFGVIFVGFHRLLFQGSSWIFPLSDTFIRLYPERFWRDTFILVVIVTGILTALVYFLGRKTANRSRTS